MRMDVVRVALAARPSKLKIRKEHRQVLPHGVLFVQALKMLRKILMTAHAKPEFMKCCTRRSNHSKAKSTENANML